MRPPSPTGADNSDTASFKSATSDPEEPKPGQPASPLENPLKFTPEEEASLIAESNELKTAANGLFARADYGSAIQSYDKALSFCPNYLDYDVAVLRANIAACHIKLAEWKATVESATKAIECLGRLQSPGQASVAHDTERDDPVSSAGQVEEVDEETALSIEAFQRSGRTLQDVEKLEVKALMRRAKARMELGGWGDLQGAEEDYKKLASKSILTPMDRKTAEKALRELPPMVQHAQQNEVNKMMGQLKDLGNGILKPFGLSTDMFQFNKDENTGGYSMQFNQNNNR